MTFIGIHLHRFFFFKSTLAFTFNYKFNFKEFYYLCGYGPFPSLVSLPRHASLPDHAAGWTVIESALIGATIGSAIAEKCVPDAWFRSGGGRAEAEAPRAQVGEGRGSRRSADGRSHWRWCSARRVERRPVARRMRIG